MTEDDALRNSASTKKMNTIIPYTCVFIDADWRDFLRGGFNCLKYNSNQDDVIRDITDFWTNQKNRNHVLPCLSVRTGLDLYLSVKNFLPGSEIIMSAINIPDMVKVVQHHRLKVVSLDVSIETTEPKVELLPSLITDKTVAILIAHVYGKWCDMEPVIRIAQQYNLQVIEDCAEGFCGFDLIGHPETDVALFSFGVIKSFTAFGGAIAKVRDDELYSKMVQLHNSYSTQGRLEYLKKIMKYFIAYIFLDCQNVVYMGMHVTRFFNIDHKSLVVSALRGFPNQMMEKIRRKPSPALLQLLRKRLMDFSQSEFDRGQVKGDYVRMRLPEDTQMVGMEAMVNNYWLFPILVENADTFVKLLNAMGVDAYRGATQLNIVEPDPSSSLGEIDPLDPRYPTEARYLIDHVVYLPVHKDVPFHALNYICKAVHRATKLSKDSPKVRIQAKDHHFDSKKEDDWREGDILGQFKPPPIAYKLGHLVLDGRLQDVIWQKWFQQNGWVFRLDYHLWQINSSDTWNDAYVMSNKHR